MILPIILTIVFGSHAEAQELPIPNPGDCPILMDSMGDTVYEYVKRGRGNREYLPDVLAEYSPPVLKPDGSLLDVGAGTINVNGNGEIVYTNTDPTQSDQLQVQRFFATETVDLSLKYMGLGHAGYHSHFGVYYYHMDDDPVPSMHAGGPVTFVHLFIQNETPPGTDATFTIPENNYFGFYLIANGNPNTGAHYTENRFNSDIGYVDEGDEQRTDGQTDHFLFFDTNHGLLLTLEDLNLSSWSYFIGDQDYEDFQVAFFKCANGDLPNVDELSIDTGEPQGGDEAGLESDNKMMPSYAARSMFKQLGVETSLKGKSPLRGVTAGNSPFKFMSSREKFDKLMLRDTSDKGLSESLPPKGPKGSGPHDVTPYDIPFVSNAHKAISVEYRKNERNLATIFATETTNGVYDHSKGICDRVNGSILEEITLTNIQGYDFITAKIKNTEKNTVDYAVLFSVAMTETGPTLESNWLPEDYSLPRDTIIRNYQVWSSHKNHTVQLVESILSQTGKLGTISYKKSPGEISAFVRKARLEGNKVTFSIKNSTSKTQNLTLFSETIRAEGSLSTHKSFSQNVSANPGINTLTVRLNDNIVDGMFYLTSQNGVRDAILISNGTFTAYDDQFLSGTSDIHFSEENCSENPVSASYGQLTIPGCGSISGFVDKKAGIYRIFNNLRGDLYEDVSFQVAGLGTAKACLEWEESSRNQCVSLTLTEIPRTVTMKPETGLRDIKALAIHFEQSGHVSVTVENIMFNRSRDKWSLIRIDDIYDNGNPKDFLRTIPDPEAILLTRYQDKWYGSSLSYPAHQLSNMSGTQIIELENIKSNLAYWVLSKDKMYGSFELASRSEALSLHHGWNLISFSYPLSIEQLTLDYPSINEVWTWDGNQWMVWSKTSMASFPLIQNIELHRGYWIKVNETE